MEITTELETIKKTSYDLLPRCRVYLFGSRARKDK